MTKTVHIIGAGGPAGIGMTRCLREHYKVIGSDKSQWSYRMMECETDPVLPDIVIFLSDNIVCQSSFRPDEKQIDLCQDKSLTAGILKDLAPKTYWVRDTVGAGGKGSQMASELLAGANYSQEYVFRDGMILAQFQKRRISYSVKERTSGLQNVGSSMVSVCTDDMDVAKVSREALNRIARATGTVLNGFYGVDMVMDGTGVPKVTEINAGRLLTASYSLYWLTGYNLPLVGVQSFLGDEVSPLPDYPLGYGIVRQTDQLPRLFTPEITRTWLE